MDNLTVDVSSGLKNGFRRIQGTYNSGVNS